LKNGTATDIFGPDLPDLNDIEIPGQPAASIFELFSDGEYQRPDQPIPLAGRMTNKSQYAFHLRKFLPAGRENAIDATLLARSLGIPWERSEGPLRGLLRTYTLRYKWPIGSVTHGRDTSFYLIDTDAEAAEYNQQLQHRIEALREQQKAVVEGWNRRRLSKTQGWDWPLEG
jgi:hypothetical protein